MTPEERSLRARLAAYEMHARHDPRDTTAKAREVGARRFEKQIREQFPGLEEGEILRRAEALKKAPYQRMALRSLQVRRGKAAASTRRGVQTTAHPEVRDASATSR